MICIDAAVRVLPARISCPRRIGSTLCKPKAACKQNNHISISFSIPVFCSVRGWKCGWVWEGGSFVTIVNERQNFIVRLPPQKKAVKRPNLWRWNNGFLLADASSLLILCRQQDLLWSPPDALETRYLLMKDFLQFQNACAFYFFFP